MSDNAFMLLISIGVIIFMFNAWFIDNLAIKHKDDIYKNIKMSGFKLELLGIILVLIIYVIFFLISLIPITKEYTAIFIPPMYICSIILHYSHIKSAAESRNIVELGIASNPHRYTSIGMDALLCPGADIYIFLLTYICTVMRDGLINDIFI